jgi:hypothetical protein
VTVDIFAIKIKHTAPLIGKEYIPIAKIKVTDFVFFEY